MGTASQPVAEAAKQEKGVRIDEKIGEDHRGSISGPRVEAPCYDGEGDVDDIAVETCHEGGEGNTDDDEKVSM